MQYFRPAVGRCVKFSPSGDEALGSRGQHLAGRRKAGGLDVLSRLNGSLQLEQGDVGIDRLQIEVGGLNLGRDSDLGLAPFVEGVVVVADADDDVARAKLFPADAVGGRDDPLGMHEGSAAGDFPPSAGEKVVWSKQGSSIRVWTANLCS